jgi:ABC-2 type transport system ATP-binding protein
MNDAVTVRELRKTFSTPQGTITALRGISFRVREGEVFAFLGPNGSGKTTTLNILSDLLAADSGEVTLLGKRKGEPGYFDAVSFMSGDSHYIWSFNGEQILRFYANLFNLPKGELKALIDRFGMGSKLHRKWEAYSNGEKTRIRLIRALMKKPRLLFLDEPTVGLDPDAASEFREQLRELRKNGMTIVLTSHYMKDIEELADNVCFIQHGEIREIGPLSDFVTLEERVEIEYHALPDEAYTLGVVQDGVLTIDVTLVSSAVQLGGVRSIRTVQRSLEDYFISLSKSGSRMMSKSDA